MQLDWPKISSCADGSEGERLLIANSLKTFNLNPEHTYVPWIVIDKNHTAQMQTNAETNLLGYLCEHNFNHVSLFGDLFLPSNRPKMKKFQFQMKILNIFFSPLVLHVFFKKNMNSI